jgi:ribosome maturation factor RimP
MTTHPVKDQIEGFLIQNLDSPQHFLVKVNVGSGKVNEGRVQVLMDSDTGITIEECAKYSRKLGAFLDENDFFEQAFTLEVASPGLDFPLTSERQFLKNIGRNLAVEIKSGAIVEGKFLSYNAGNIDLEVSEKNKGKKAIVKLVHIPSENILKAKVTVSFK